MTIFTIEKLHSAYTHCLRHKRDTVNALKFELHRERELYGLLRDLQSGKYRISRHICFVVTDPAPREIFAGTFRDRVVQHLLCSEIQALFERDFSEHSYANRAGKGAHKGFKQLRFHVCRGGRDRQRLEQTVGAVERFLQRTCLLTLCADKTVLARVERGIDFLGYFIKPTHTLVRRRIVRRLKKKIYETKDPRTGLFPVTMLPVLQSYKGHFSHAHSVGLSKKYF